MTKTAPERLVALESIEPELLDESQIGRILLALEVTLLVTVITYCNCNNIVEVSQRFGRANPTNSRF